MAGQKLDTLCFRILNGVSFFCLSKEQYLVVILLNLLTVDEGICWFREKPRFMFLMLNWDTLSGALPSLSLIRSMVTHIVHCSKAQLRTWKGTDVLWTSVVNDTSFWFLALPANISPFTAFVKTRKSRLGNKYNLRVCRGIICNIS